MTDELDLAFTALTIWREAQGEPLEGQRAVLHVILNRVADRRWPNTAYEVCIQPKQFSCYNAGDPCAVKWPKRGTPPWDQILELVRNPGEDPTKGANHYCVEGLKPAWAETRLVTAKIGKHVFYKLA
jgi:N-acetylmuramoyl-L-alanine amidase